MRYSVEATPDPPAPSEAASVNDGRVVYQPAALAAGMVSVVVGAVVSGVGTKTDSSPLATLPATSVARYATA